MTNIIGSIAIAILNNIYNEIIWTKEINKSNYKTIYVLKQAQVVIEDQNDFVFRSLIIEAQESQSNCKKRNFAIPNCVTMPIFHEVEFTFSRVFKYGGNRGWAEFEKKMCLGGQPRLLCEKTLNYEYSAHPLCAIKHLDRLLARWPPTPVDFYRFTTGVLRRL